MAKRKTGATSTKKKAGFASLVGTQRAALDAPTSKRGLAALAVALASQHGSAEQKALTQAELERGTRRGIQSLVVELARQGQVGKVVHLSELGGWPACWPDDRRDSSRAEEILTTAITVTADDVTCGRCRKAADLPSPEETAAFQRAEVEAASEAPTRRNKRAPAKKGGESGGGKRGKRQLSLKADLPVRMKIKDVEIKGVVQRDGTLVAAGKSYPNPHVAANDIAGKLVAYRIDGFQAWRFQDPDGRWRMLRDHA